MVDQDGDKQVTGEPLRKSAPPGLLGNKQDILQIAEEDAILVV